MDKLKTTSKRLQALVLLLIALTPCAVALNAATGEWAQLVGAPAGILLDATRIHGGALAAVIALGLIKPLAHMLAFWFLYKLLGLYRQGIIFTAENVGAIRKIGWALVGIDIASMARTVLAGPVLTAFDVTQGYVSVGLEAGFVTVGLFVVLVAHVMELGRELKEQDDLVI